MAKQEGRKVPLHIKKLRGTAHPTRVRRSGEIDIGKADYSEVTLPPEHLTDEGKELWMRVIAYHSSWKLNLPTHYEYLESYCRAYEVREQSWRTMMEEGIYVIEGETETKPGVKRLSPAYKAYNEQVDKMLVLGQKLFLSAIDMAKLNASMFDEGDNNKDKNSIKRIGVTG